MTKRSRIVVGGLLACVLALAIWAVLTAQHSQHRALDNPDMALEYVRTTSPDPRRLAAFYADVFGMQTPERNNSYLLPNDPASTVVLQLPGYQATGPLLVLTQAQEKPAHGPLQVYDLGYAHLCFESDDVYRITRLIEARGGTVLSTFDDIQAAAAIYAKDPDGNAIEVHIPLPEPVTPWTIARTLNTGVRTYFKLPPVENTNLRFLHVNINSTNWQRTVAFYQQAFDAVPTGIERNYDGDFIRKVTGVAGAVVRGRHVALPGFSPGGPTFEIFTYNKPSSQGPLTLADVGRVATGFRVVDLRAALARIEAAGGVVVRHLSDNVVLVKDTDGNLLTMRQRAR